MKEVEVFVGPCSKFVDGQGWTTEIPIEKIKAKGYRKDAEVAKDLIIEFNEWINEHYDAKYDAYCVCIPVDKVSEFLTQKLKEYGVEVE